ncbi:MAG: class I SAM-dependent methyltransferase [Mariprofundaceae bacterium]
MAHHKPLEKPRWSASQKAEVMKLQSRGLNELHTSAGKRYDTIIHALPNPLPIDASVLDIGCGAVCTAKLFNASNTTYIDPLLNDFKRTFPGELPDGEFISGEAEEIAKPDSSYDLILCLNTLSFVLNPELVLHEVRRLLKKNAPFVVSISVWSELFARLYYLKTRYFSLGETQNRLYCYTYRGIKNTLQRHFEIINEIQLDTKTEALAQEWMFICQKKNPDNNES